MGIAFKGGALVEMEKYWIKKDLYEKKKMQKTFGKSVGMHKTFYMVMGI